VLTFIQEEKVIRLFQQFNLIAKLLSNLDESHDKYQQRRKFLLSFLEIVKELEVLREVKDVLDEIGMLQAVLLDQETVFSAMSDPRFDKCPFRSVGGRANGLVQFTKRSLQNMKDRAQAVERGVSFVFAFEVAKMYVCKRRG
jgi:hypothetical protein